MNLKHLIFFERRYCLCICYQASHATAPAVLTSSGNDQDEANNNNAEDNDDTAKDEKDAGLILTKK